MVGKGCLLELLHPCFWTNSWDDHIILRRKEILFIRIYTELKLVDSIWFYIKDINKVTCNVPVNLSVKRLLIILGNARFNLKRKHISFFCKERRKNIWWFHDSLTWDKKSRWVHITHIIMDVWQNTWKQTKSKLSHWYRSMRHTTQRKRSINKIPCSKVNIILKVTSYILNNVLKVGHNQLFVHFTIVMCGALYGCWKLTTRCGDWTDYQLWS